jgi:hypothetical protein
LCIIITGDIVIRFLLRRQVNFQVLLLNETCFTFAQMKHYSIDRARARSVVIRLQDSGIFIF